MNETKKLVELIIEGIQEKKGSGIVVVNLENIDGAICRYFIICQLATASGSHYRIDWRCGTGKACREAVARGGVGKCPMGSDGLF